MSDPAKWLWQIRGRSHSTCWRYWWKVFAFLIMSLFEELRQIWHRRNRSNNRNSYFSNHHSIVSLCFQLFLSNWWKVFAFSIMSLFEELRQIWHRGIDLIIGIVIFLIIIQSFRCFFIIKNMYFSKRIVIL